MPDQTTGRLTENPAEGERAARNASAGDAIAADLVALRSACVLIERSASLGVRLTGSEREPFLQRMATCDVARLGTNRVADGLLLTAKGTLVSPIRVAKLAQELIVMVEAGRGAAVAEHLERHLITEDCVIEPMSAGAACFALAGPGARDCAAGAFGAASSVEPGAVGRTTDGWTTLGGRIAGEPAVEIIGPAAELRARAQTLVAQETSSGPRLVNEAAIAVARVETAEGGWGSEYDEQTVAAEVGFESAIGFDKGCYLGQESVARAAARPRQHRQFVALAFPDGPLSAGAELFAAPAGAAPSDAAPAGRVTSVARSPIFGEIGIGLVGREQLAAPGGLRSATGQRAVVRSAVRGAG